RQLDWMAYNGYTVVTKRAKRFRRLEITATGEEVYTERIKGDMDIELAIDMLTMAEYCERIVLLPGDGDLRRLAEAVHRRGVGVQLVSTQRTREYGLADERRGQADACLQIA